MKEEKKVHSYDQVKSHYERAAENRNNRLLTSKLNAAKVNHQERLKIIDSIFKRIGIVKEGIDIGTGTGVWAEMLLDYCENITGIDFAKENIRISREKAANKNLEKRLTYIEGDAEFLDGINENYFDIATHISVLQHLPNHERALQGVYGVLKKKGQLIILVHNNRCIYNRNLYLQNKRGSITEINKYSTLEEIVYLLETTGFQIKQIRLCWFFVFDLLMIGIENPKLRPVEPFRKVLLAIISNIAGWLGKFQVLNPLFREIIIVAQK
ncbi:class I SAM-dependent methyltransferase [Thermodesulfobacteriota bacterium]